MRSARSSPWSSTSGWPCRPDRVEPLPLRVRQRGLRLGGEQTGHLLAWARTSTGHWLALVRVTASAGAAGSVAMTQWVPAHTVRERDEATDDQR